MLGGAACEQAARPHFLLDKPLPVSVAAVTDEAKCKRTPGQPSSKPARQGSNTMVASRSVNQCCCGCSLKTGSILIGGLSLLHGATSLIMILQSVQDTTTDSFVEGYGHYSTVGIYMALVFAAIVAFCQVVMGMLLIKGADRCRPQLVRPWLLFSYFKFGVDIVSAAFIIYTNISSHSSANYPALLAAVGVGLSVEIYCIMVVYSFYKQLMAHGDIAPLKEQI